MKYRKDKYGNPLSVLGYGCMRFQRKQGKIDMALAQKQVMAAYEGGVNYYDTAYIYPGSEAAIGEIFEKNGIREKINIATKLPHYMIKSMDGIEKECRPVRGDCHGATRLAMTIGMNILITCLNAAHVAPFPERDISFH